MCGRISHPSRIFIHSIRLREPIIGLPCCNRLRKQEKRTGIHQHTLLTDHLATIIYTSGTTGTPKGVMLTHRNILSNVMLSKASFPFEDRPDFKALSFLPLNHIFEKMVSYIYMLVVMVFIMRKVLIPLAPIYWK